LCRYGGDEFIIIARAFEATEVERMIGDIRRGMLDASIANDLPYQLSVSVGFDEWKPEREGFQDCLVRADEKLYAEKRESKFRPSG
ncbi:MAG: diguanylate cyclase, partial [Oscillospiraceae bacterium]|nr:diguanylate cyclase [Oscillospiraceae bacterium]